MLAFLHHALTGHELGLWTAMGRLCAELLAMLRRQVVDLDLLTCAFGALGGTRTPNLLIRSWAGIVQRLPQKSHTVANSLVNGGGKGSRQSCRDHAGHDGTKLLARMLAPISLCPLSSHRGRRVLGPRRCWRRCGYLGIPPLACGRGARRRCPLPGRTALASGATRSGYGLPETRTLRTSGQLVVRRCSCWVCMSQWRRASHRFPEAHFPSRAQDGPPIDASGQSGHEHSTDNAEAEGHGELPPGDIS